MLESPLNQPLPRIELQDIPPRHLVMKHHLWVTREEDFQQRKARMPHMQEVAQDSFGLLGRRTEFIYAPGFTSCFFILFYTYKQIYYTHLSVPISDIYLEIVGTINSTLPSGSVSKISCFYNPNPHHDLPDGVAWRRKELNYLNNDLLSQYRTSQIMLVPIKRSAQGLPYDLLMSREHITVWNSDSFLECTQVIPLT